MEVDQPMTTDKKSKKRPKKPLLKLKLPEDHTTPNFETAGVTEETKAADSMQSTSSYNPINVSEEQIDLQDEMNKFAPQVHGDTITLKKQFVEPSCTLDSNADVSMTSNSLCNKIAESSLGSGTMSFEDIIQIDKTVMKNNDKQDNSNLEEELESEFKENEAILKGNKDLDVTIKLSDLRKVGVLGQGASGYVSIIW